MKPTATKLENFKFIFATLHGYFDCNDKVEVTVTATGKSEDEPDFANILLETDSENFEFTVQCSTEQTAEQIIGAANSALEGIYPDRLLITRFNYNTDRTKEYLTQLAKTYKAENLSYEDFNADLGGDMSQQNGENLTADADKEFQKIIDMVWYKGHCVDTKFGPIAKDGDYVLILNFDYIRNKAETLIGRVHNGKVYAGYHNGNYVHKVKAECKISSSTVPSSVKQAIKKDINCNA